MPLGKIDIEESKRKRVSKKIKNCYDEDKYETKDELYSEFYDNPYNEGIKSKVKVESEATKRHR